MIAYRIVKRRYSKRDHILNGEGSRESGGRWNDPGLPLVYASENRSLAMLEKLLQVSLENLPTSLVLVAITIPGDTHVTRFEQTKLPKNWRTARNVTCMRLGSQWITSKVGLVLRVPSAANPYEENILLNPLHRDIERCTVSAPVPIRFDPRLQTLLNRPHVPRGRQT